MKINPTPLTAALAGVFSALVWPPLWSRFGGAGSAGTVELIVAMLLVVALPAHAFVVGIGSNAGGNAVAPGRSIDTALLKRIGAWLAAAVVTALVGAALRA